MVGLGLLGLSWLSCSSLGFGFEVTARLTTFFEGAFIGRVLSCVSMLLLLLAFDSLSPGACDHESSGRDPARASYGSNRHHRRPGNRYIFTIFQDRKPSRRQQLRQSYHWFLRVATDVTEPQTQGLL